MPKIYGISEDKERLLIGTGKDEAEWFTPEQLGQYIKKSHLRKAAREKEQLDYNTKCA